MTYTISIVVFLVLISATLVMTYISTKRVKTSKDFYAAGRSITGCQNGLAIAGEFMASAAFLGIPGLIALYGIDAQIYSFCWVGSFLVVLVLAAEVIRNLGKFTFADIVTYKLNDAKVRPFISVCVLIVSLTYLIPQIVAAGALSKLLFGIPEVWGILVVGSLIVIYIGFGGMVAVTWIAMIKAVLLLVCTYLLVFFTMSHFGFSLSNLFEAVATAEAAGPAWFEPGGWLSSPWERFSLGLGLLFGTAAMPHVIMRFYTVPTKKQARSSALWCIVFMSLFHLTTFILGFGALALVGRQTIVDAAANGNLATPLLALAAAGGEGTLGGQLFMAVIVSVAFITIIAAASGLCIAASSTFSYDLWFKVVKKEKQSPESQVKTARISALAFGAVAIVGALALKDFNVAYLSGLAFAVAATVNLPCILYSLYWKGITTKGAQIGIVSGVVISVLSIVLGPSVMGANAIIPLSNPGILTIPLGFLITYLACKFTSDPQALARHAEMAVRSQSGLGAEK